METRVETFPYVAEGTEGHRLRGQKQEDEWWMDLRGGCISLTAGTVTR